MPVYNGEPFIRRAIDSLLVQTFTDFELIVSDNASTDNTESICREYATKDNRIKYIRQSINMGATAHFQFVAAKARSEYFMWAACDDCWMPGFVESLLRALQLDSRADVAFCDLDRFWEDGVFLDRIAFGGSRNPRNMGHLGLAYSIAAQSRHYFFIYGLFRTNFLKNLVKQFPDGAAFDQVFMCRIALITKFAYVNEVLHIRTARRSRLEDRSGKDDPLSKSVCKATRYFSIPFQGGAYLMNCEDIPLKRKVFVPFLMGRWFCSMIKPGCIHLTKTMLIVFVGRSKAEKIRNSLRSFFRSD